MGASLPTNLRWQSVARCNTLRRGLRWGWMIVMLSGCVTTTHIVGQANRPAVMPQVQGKGSSTYADAGPISADEALGTDPCEARLQNIEAAMLLYYSLKGELPPRLEDLVSLSSDDLPLTCPVSNLEYLYIRGGLPVPGSTRRIIVCDATPAHLGKRWCITMAPITPGAALELEPEKLPESVFKDYRPNGGN